MHRPRNVEVVVVAPMGSEGDGADIWIACPVAFAYLPEVGESISGLDGYDLCVDSIVHKCIEETTQIALVCFFAGDVPSQPPMGWVRSNQAERAVDLCVQAHDLIDEG